MNEIKPNQNKCHILIFDATHKYYFANSYKYLNNAFIEGEESVKLLGVHIDQNLNFQEHIISLLKEGNNKFHALMHVEQY